MNKYETYLHRYANDYCNGNVEEAKHHAIVQAVKQQYDEEENSQKSEKVL